MRGKRECGKKYKRKENMVMEVRGEGGKLWSKANRSRQIERKM